MRLRRPGSGRHELLLDVVGDLGRGHDLRDVVLGGNAVDYAGPGYDLVTGLGTPNVENLAQNILVTQKVVG